MLDFLAGVLGYWYAGCVAWFCLCSKAVYRPPLFAWDLSPRLSAAPPPTSQLLSLSLSLSLSHCLLFPHLTVWPPHFCKAVWGSFSLAWRGPAYITLSLPTLTEHITTVCPLAMELETADMWLWCAADRFSPFLHRPPFSKMAAWLPSSARFEIICSPGEKAFVLFSKERTGGTHGNKGEIKDNTWSQEHPTAFTCDASAGSLVWFLALGVSKCPWARSLTPIAPNGLVGALNASLSLLVCDCMEMSEWEAWIVQRFG